MNLENKINTDLKAAMLSKNEASLRALRAIKAAILLVKTSEGKGGQITYEDEAKLLQKLVKQRKDSIEIYEQQNRPELAQKEKEEIIVIEKYLPEQLDEAQLREIIGQIVSESGASSPADMGKVMGIAIKKLSGRADGKTISGIVKEILSGS